MGAGERAARLVTAVPAARPWLAWRIAPERIERPGDAGELAALVAACAARRAAVLPVGAGLALAAAGIPERAEVALCLDGLSGIVAHAPEDLTVTVRAGTRLAELVPVLAEKGQWLPGAPADGGTVGGLVACGFAAPEDREAFGLVRERVLGMQVAGADGKLARSGGRVVKNVAGYDLHRMHAGACGAFGVIAEVCLRLESLPEERAAVGLRAGSLAALEEAWRWLRREGPEAACVEVRAAGDGEVRARASFAGDAEPVREAVAAVRRAWGRWGTAEPLEGTAPPPGETSVAEPGRALELRVLVAPARTFAAHAHLAAAVGERGVAASMRSYPGAGEIRMRLEGAGSAVASCWGLVAEGARAGRWHHRVADEPAGLAAAAPAWSAEPAALRLLARLKRVLDPHGVLRPGSYSADRLEAAAAFFDPVAGEAAS